MSGLTSLLNVAKVGLMAHQLNLQTTGHNVANVNTEGYSRQNVTLSAATPTPSAIGPIGNGVKATEITRDYDKFITTTLMGKTSITAGLDTRQSSMKLIEQTLNEVDENGLNSLLSDFWNSWDDLANNAEGMSERTTLLQKSKLLVQGLRDRYNSLLKLSQDIDLNIQSSIDDINQLADQIAELNVQIVSSESSSYTANDLRDKRDELLKKLCKLTDVHYFETNRGTYTVLIGQGNPLVDADQSWHLEMRGDTINWLGSNGQAVELTTDDVGNGQLGGYMDIKDRISPKDPSTLTSSQVNTSSGRAIKGSTRWDAIDGVSVTGDFTIRFSGTDQDGLPVSSTFQYTYPGNPPPPNESNATVQDFLDAIESAYQDTSVVPPVDRVSASITDDGRIQIKDLVSGEQNITFQIDKIEGGIHGLNLGKFDGSYPLNYLGKLNLIGQELIKTVNAQHAQGVGLEPMQETTGTNYVPNLSEPIGRRSSGLKFASDIQNGQFELWLYDANGNIIDADPSTSSVNDPLVVPIQAEHTTLYDIRDAINNATMPLTGSSAGLKARILDGRLVIQASGDTSTAGFAFGRDTSGALMALGLNSFFTGYDASTIGINPKLQENQRLVAAAQVEPRGASEAMSTSVLQDETRPLGIKLESGNISIWAYDQNGNLVDGDSDQDGINPYVIKVDPTTMSLQDVVDSLNKIDGIEAEISNQKVNIRVTNDKWKGISFGPDTTGVLKYMGIDAVYPASVTPGATYEMVARNAVTDPSKALNTSGSGLSGYGSVTSGSFDLYVYDSTGNPVNLGASSFPPSATITVDSTPTLGEIVSAINGLPGGVVSASIGSDGRLVIASSAGNRVMLGNDSSGIVDALGLPSISSDISGLYSVDRVTESLNHFDSGITDGHFYLYNFDDQGNYLSEVARFSSANQDTSTGAAITESSLWNNISGVTNEDGTGAPGEFTIYYSGTRQDGTTFSGEYTGNSTTSPANTDVASLLTGIEDSFKLDSTDPTSPVDAIIDDSGRLALISKDGRPISFRIDAINGDISGLDFGVPNAAPAQISHTNFTTAAGPPPTYADGTTQWDDILELPQGGAGNPDFSAQFTVNFSGINQDGTAFSASYVGNSGGVANDVNSFLTAIESAFGTDASGNNRVDATIDDSGRISVVSNDGRPVSFNIESIEQGGTSYYDYWFGPYQGLYTVKVDADHDSLADIAGRIDSMYNLTSSAENGKIVVQTEGNSKRFVAGSDTSSLLSTTDFNTPSGGLMSPANNLNALALRDVNRKTVEDLDDATISEAYQGLVGTVGIHSRGFKLDYEFSKKALDELQARRDEVSGVSLDEEMANLIKFQHAYSAAAKLIKTADDMFKTLLETR